MNQIMGLCFKEISLKKRDLNGKNQFGRHHCILFIVKTDFMWLQHVVGWGPTQATIRRGVRMSTYKAYLKRCMNAPNLHVLTNTLVEKVSVLSFRISCKQFTTWAFRLCSTAKKLMESY